MPSLKRPLRDQLRLGGALDASATSDSVGPQPGVYRGENRRVCDLRPWLSCNDVQKNLSAAGGSGPVLTLADLACRGCPIDL